MKMQRVISFEISKINILLFYWVFVFKVKSFESKIEGSVTYPRFLLGETWDINHHQFYPKKTNKGEFRPFKNVPSTKLDTTSTASPTETYLPNYIVEKLFLIDLTPSTKEEARKSCQRHDMKLFKPKTWNTTWDEMTEFVHTVKRFWLCAECMTPNIEIWTDLHVNWVGSWFELFSCWLERISFLHFQLWSTKCSGEEICINGHLTLQFSYKDNTITPLIASHDTKLPYICVKEEINYEGTSTSTMFTNTPTTTKATSTTDSDNVRPDMLTKTTSPATTTTITTDTENFDPDTLTTSTMIAKTTLSTTTAATTTESNNDSTTVTFPTTTATTPTDADNYNPNTFSFSTTITSTTLSTTTATTTTESNNDSTTVTFPTTTATTPTDADNYNPNTFSFSTTITSTTLSTTTTGSNNDRTVFTDTTLPTTTASTTTDKYLNVTDEYCKGRKTFDTKITINWPDTDLGKNATILPCPRGSYGYATWHCNKTERNFTGDPEVSCHEIDCSKPPEKFNDTVRFKNETVKSYFGERLHKCGDVGKEKVFQKMRESRENFKSKPPREMRQGMDMSLGMYNRLVDKDSAMWKDMSEEDSRDTSIELIKETEDTAWMLGCEDGDEVAMKKDNLAIGVFHLCKNQTWQELDLNLTSKEIGKVYLPGNLTVKQNTMCGKPVQRGILAGYQNIESYLNPNGSMKITSGIIGVSLGSNGSFSLPENKTIRIILKHPPISSGTNRICVFLNVNYKETNSTYGVWDNKGCEVIRSEEEFTECECNHLTNFAILMDFAGTEFSERDVVNLKILSFICCCISSVALLLTVIIYLTVRSLRNRRNTITCNLAACLLVMNILVQTGLSRVEKTICQIVSALLQYSVLSAFFWMLLEGILLYRMVITVFHTKNVRTFILYIVAYGIPFLIVVLSSAMYPAQMIRDDYCWLSKEKGMIWSVLGPVILVISVNLIIFGLTLNAAAKIDRMNSTNTSFDAKKKTLVQRSKGMMSLTCLLGFTWAIGFFYVPMKEVAAYLFVVFNGLQGFFLFLTQMIFNDPVRSKLFAIYKESFSRLSSKNSSLPPMNVKTARNAKEDPKEANEKTLKKSKSEQSIVCPPSEEDPPSAPPPPYEELQVRTIVFKSVQQQTNGPCHPFAVNTETKHSSGYLPPIIRRQ